MSGALWIDQPIVGGNALCRVDEKDEGRKGGAGFKRDARSVDAERVQPAAQM